MMPTIYDYLKGRGAYGKSKSITAREIRARLNLTARQLDASLYRELRAGQLIISKTADGGGYYLPASVEDVREFVRQQEGRIKKHAVTLKAAREFLRQRDGPSIHDRRSWKP